MSNYSVSEDHVRLARDGECLEVFQFPSGTKGFVSATPSRRLRLCRGPEVVPSVICLPECARVRLFNLPLDIRHEFGVSEVEDATFIELPTHAQRFPDAVQFDNGKILALQELPVGQHVEVLRLTEPLSTARWTPRRKKHNLQPIAEAA